MSFTYAVLGAGRQGTAAAYDMARFGDAVRVKVGDVDLEAAKRAAARVNTLVGREIAYPFAVDAADPAAVRAFLEDVDSFLSAVPYWLNPAIARIAIEARACMTDLGGNTDLVRGQLLLSPEAEAAGIAMIPDCGQVPGMGTSLTAYAMSLLDETDEVTFWDGGNPLHPEPPFNYILTFNIAGLTNEYYGVAHFLRDGQRVEVPTFLEEDYEIVDFPAPIGRMEAFVAGGGTSTMPWTFEGKLRTLWNKTLRWPGHFAAWKAYMDAGPAGDRAGRRRRRARRAPRPPPCRPGPEDPGEAGRAGPRDRPRAGEGAEGRPAGRGARRADRPLRRGDRLHGDGADDRLGRLDQGDHERAWRHAEGRPSGRGRGLGASLRGGAPTPRLRPHGVGVGAPGVIDRAARHARILPGRCTTA